MAEVGIEDIAKGEVAFERLHVIELRAAANPVEQVADERHDVIDDEERGHGTDGGRHANESYFFRARILELRCEDGKFMLSGERAKHCPVTASDRIETGYPVIENGDAQSGLPMGGVVPLESGHFDE